MTQCLEFVMISAAVLTCLLGAPTQKHFFGIDQRKKYVATSKISPFLQFFIYILGIAPTFAASKLLPWILEPINAPADVIFGLKRAYGIAVFNFYCHAIVRPVCIMLNILKDSEKHSVPKVTDVTKQST